VHHDWFARACLRVLIDNNKAANRHFIQTVRELLALKVMSNIMIFPHNESLEILCRASMHNSLLHMWHQHANTILINSKDALNTAAFAFGLIPLQNGRTQRYDIELVLDDVRMQKS